MIYLFIFILFYIYITRMNTSERLINMPLVYFKCNFKAQFAEVNSDDIFILLTEISLLIYFLH